MELHPFLAPVFRPRPSSLMAMYCRVLRSQAQRRAWSAAPLRRAAAPSTAQPTADAPKLTWPDFFALRKRQRRLAVFASVPTTALGLSLGVSYFASIEAVPTDLIFGIEPIYAYAVATIGCTMLGWLAGPTIGNLIFRLTVPRARYTAMQRRNAEFYEHVKRNRVDPSRQSVNNPVPDWHCEKPGSMAAYRQWLRDQAAYRRKASQHGMLFGKNDANSARDLL